MDRNTELRRLAQALHKSVDDLAYLDKLEALNIPVLESAISRITSQNGEIRCMDLEGGMQLDCDRLYFAIGQYPADDLGVQLKCERDEGGHIVVDVELRQVFQRCQSLARGCGIPNGRASFRKNGQRSARG